MIVLDTHIWIWWVQGDNNLSADQRVAIGRHEATGLGVSAISCWEVAKLAEGNRGGVVQLTGGVLQGPG